MTPLRKSSILVRMEAKWHGFWGRGLRAKHRIWARYILSFIWSLPYIYGNRKLSAKDIPVIINSFNRITSLRKLIGWLERAGFDEIIIIDNSSTFPPLLQYLRESSHRVIYGPNGGPYALWKNKVLWHYIRNRFYIYTDADVVPDEECPLNLPQRMFEILISNIAAQKIGLGLRIDNLPNSYAKKAHVIAWESKYWQNEIATGVFIAPVDTTFALYRPFSAGWESNALRTGFPYVALHTPWYENSASPSDEDLYYYNTVMKGASTWSDGFGVAQVPANCS